MFSESDRLYYQASRDILPGDELLVFYGWKYLQNLGMWQEYRASAVSIKMFLDPGPFLGH